MASRDDKTLKPIKALCCGDNTLPIKFLPLKKMVQYATILMIAKRGSGKSWIVRSLLYHFKDIPVGTIICPTDEETNFYSSLIPSLYVHYKYSSKLIHEIFIRQQKMIQKYNEYLEHDMVVDPRCFVIMDDCLASKNEWVKDQNLKTMLMNGRHKKIMFMLTMQAPLGIDPTLRDQFDYVFLLRCNKINEQQKIYQHYAGMFSSFQLFKQVHDALTQDYGALVIDNRTTSNNLLETIYWYKAEPQKNVVIGCKQYIKYHKDNYNSKWRDIEKIVDFDNFDKKQRINIAKKL